MTIKKILILFCLIPIALNCYGMSDKLPNGSSRQLTNLTEIYQNYLNYLDRLIQAREETLIISFLTKNSNFLEMHLSTILSKLAHAQLHEVVDHILQKSESIIIDADRNKLIEIALTLNDIERVKNLTGFDRNFNESKAFSLNQYVQGLTIEGLDGRAIFNKIFFYDKKNYMDTRGFRCFNLMLTDVTQNFEEIIEFINSTSIEHLNVQDINGHTPLMHSAWLWQNYKPKYQELKNQQKAIIKALLRRRVNIKIQNNQGKTFKNSTFFKTYAKKCNQWRARRISIPQPIAMSLDMPQNNPKQEAIKKKPAHVGLKIAVSVGASIAGTAVLYLCYKFFNKNRINGRARLK